MHFKKIITQSFLPNNYQLITMRSLFLSSGEIVIGDPFSKPDSPLNIKIPLGNYNVDLFYKDYLEWGHRVAFASLVINKNKKITYWESANNTHGFNDIFVDSGLACFADFKTMKAFSSLLETFKQNTPPNNYYDLILKNEIRKKVFSGKRISSFGIHHPFANKENIAIFECGIGDGSYKAYYGKDTDHNLSMILIDFDISD